MTLSQAAKDFKDEVRWTVKGELMQGRLSATIWLHRPNNKTDIDNFSKLILDSLQGILYENDSQIDELHIYKYVNRKDPHVLVEVNHVKKNAKFIHDK